jgi:DNA-directed RNA polymerase subunit RPC12/RpoP
MAIVKFECSHCSQHLEAPDEMSGESVDCPSCGVCLVVPDALVVPTSDSGLDETTSEILDSCPFCDAQVLPEDSSCMRCGHMFLSGSVPID